MVLFWHELLTSASARWLSLIPPRRTRPTTCWISTTSSAPALDTFENVLGDRPRPGDDGLAGLQTNNKGKPSENFAGSCWSCSPWGSQTATHLHRDGRAGGGGPFWVGARPRKFIYRPQQPRHRDEDHPGEDIPLRRRGRDQAHRAAAHAARYLSRRLFQFFVHPDPTEKDLQPLIAEYTRSGECACHPARPLHLPGVLLPGPTGP